MKRILYIFLAACMAFSLIGPIAVTADYELPEFEITNGKLTDYNGEGGDVVIPDTVTVIGMDAFSSTSTITSVTIPSSVTKIEAMAFANCHNIYEIYFEEGCREIGDCAFSYCTSLSYFTMPNSVRTLGTGVFEGCSSLVGVELSRKLTEIPATTFSACRSLSYFEIPSNIKTVGDMAFSFCSALTEVTFPSSVTTAGQYIFLDCYYLQSVTVPQHLNTVMFQFYLPHGTMIKILGQETEEELPPPDENEDTDTDTNTDTNTGTNTDTNTETNTNPGTQPGYRPGNTTTTQPGYRPGTNTGSTTTTKEPYGQGEFKKTGKFFSTTYSDVSTSNWFYTSVANAYEYNLMFGKTGATFNPGDTMTVAEAITIACRLHTTYHGRTAVTVSMGNVWYKNYVDYALKNNIIKENGFVNYNFEITRAEMARIFANTLPKEWLGKINDVNEVPDMNKENADYNSVLTLYQAGICSGSDASHNYKPDTNIKRSEVAAIITRLADKSLRVTF